MSSDATLIEERQLARSTPVHAIRLAIIVQLILVFSVLVYSLESEEKLDKMLKEDLVRGAIQKPIVNEMDFKQHIESLVDEMHASHANFLLGVDEVLLVKEDLKFSNDSNNCETPHVLGALAENDIIIKDSGKEMNAHIFYHEWAIMSTSRSPTIRKKNGKTCIAARGGLSQDTQALASRNISQRTLDAISLILRDARRG